ncbi:hypothetical protein C8Q79DRAFT_923147 [Trametes meyenii]|nr:hypothetical protein C8Q79DRAFT_923147 [Trametes meyenii]
MTPSSLSGGRPDSSQFRRAAEAIAHYSILWSGDVPDSLVERVYEGRREHIEAAHAWLRITLNLLEKADSDGEGGALSIELAPTQETVALLSLALEKNYTYFRLLEKAVQMALDYLVQEQEVLQEWCLSQTVAVSGG